MNSNNQGSNSDSNRKCSICNSKTSYKEKNKWGEYEHWYGSRENPVCGRCHARAKWKERFVPVDVKCEQ